MAKEDLNTIPMLSVTIAAMKKDMNVGMVNRNFKMVKWKIYDFYLSVK